VGAPGLGKGTMLPKKLKAHPLTLHNLSLDYFGRGKLRQINGCYLRLIIKSIGERPGAPVAYCAESSFELRAMVA
jgi:hypothetical protein